MKRPESMSAAEIEQELAQLHRRIDALDSSGQPTGWLTARIVTLNQALERRAHAGQTNTPRSVAKGLFAQMRQHVAGQPSYESRAVEVAHALLEMDGDDVKDDLLANGEDARLSAFPDDFRPFLDAMPEAAREEFLRAYGRPDGYAVYEDGEMSVVGEGWPTSDGDNDDPAMRWMEIHYSHALRINDGRLYVGVESNHEGDVSNVDEAEWGTPGHFRLRKEFGLKAWYESLTAYFTEVAETGVDPLRYISVNDTRIITTHWLVGIREENGRPKFWKARQIRSKKPSPAAVDDPAGLPEAVRQYLNLDENGFLADFTDMVEFTALPEVKAKDGFWQVTVETNEKKQNEAVRQRKVKAAARRLMREYETKANATDEREALVVP